MPRFNDRFKDKITRSRNSQRNLIPQAITTRTLSQEMFNNSTVERLSASVGDGSKATVTTTLTAQSGSERRIGMLPYMIQVYIGSATTNNILPSGSAVATTDYTIYSWAVPQVTGGTDGNNVVWKTTVANNSGGAVTMIFDVQSRYIIAGAGGQEANV